MQTFNSFNELASSTQPCQSAVSVFNDQARITEIKQLYTKLHNEPRNEEIRKKLHTLVDQEISYWEKLQQDPSKVTEAQKKECTEFNGILGKMDQQLYDGKTVLDGAFTPHPGFGTPRKPSK
jgi:hypothetical protein